MEITEIKCDNYGKTVYVLEEFMRKKMFCILGRFSEFENKMKCEKQNYGSSDNIYKRGM